MEKLYVSARSKVFSRELSWLAFNERVLEEASDPSNPLLERVKYLTILSSNLEEFYRVRYAGLLRKNDSGRGKEARDEIPVDQLISRIRHWVNDQKSRQAQIFDQLCLELYAAGLLVEQAPSKIGHQVFQEKILPHIKIIPLKHDGDIENLTGGKLYMLAKLDLGYSLIEISDKIPRLWIAKSRRILMVDRLIYHYKHELFPKKEIHDLFAFKLSRDAEIDLDEDTEDVVKDMEEQIKKRDLSPIVRVEVDSPLVAESVQWLQKKLKIDKNRLLQITMPLDLKAFMLIYNVKQLSKHRFHYPDAKRPKSLPKGLSPIKYFKILDGQDVLLHHPYSSFDPVVEFLQVAARDPKVTRICQTLYRTAKDSSPIMEALVAAAQAGKKVTAVVEIKARFDEANNLKWAKSLHKAGVRVIYSPTELKVHAKVIYVERGKGAAAKGYVHMSTGNYHPRTARLYTDLGILSSDPRYAKDAKTFFDYFENTTDVQIEQLIENSKEFYSLFEHWLISPHHIQANLIRLIDRETAFAKAGKAARIVAKINGLVEESLCEHLYRAGQAGVKIDLMVRGMCNLRPGVPGKSENIRVRSIIDKYLEHSRFFFFENGGHREGWISSADWMHRNFQRRIEVAVPIFNPAMANYIFDTIWKIYDSDNVRARECNEDGFYNRVFAPTEGKAQKHRAQFIFETEEIPEFPRRPLPAAKGTTEEPPKDLPKESARESTKEVTKDLVKDLAKDSAKDSPTELVKEIPKELQKELLKELPKELAQGLIKELVKDTLKDAAKEDTTKESSKS